MNELPPAGTQASPSYRWVIVVAVGVMIFITYGLIYSYSVFFKPLVLTFNWDRATVSSIYSLSVIIRGAAAIGAGWLADKYGPRKVLVGCGLLMAAGFILSSRVTELWQFFLTYAVIEAVGMSGTFSIGTALVAQWFTPNRGLALGIVGAGSGLGTFLVVPGAERLVSATQWSTAYVIIGLVSGALMIIAAAFLRRPPAVAPATEKSPSASSGATVGQAIRDPRLLLIMICFLFFFFGIQIIMVHLVNYATDKKIDPLIAATFISVIGAGSIASRLTTGVIAEKIGLYKTLMLTGVFLAVAFVLLLFTGTIWSFYVFAVIFSIPYGGEVTQIPLVISRYFGTQAMATLMGVTLFVIGLGGALGPWIAGKIFDVTKSYNGAFITGAIAAVGSMAAVSMLRRADSRNN